MIQSPDALRGGDVLDAHIPPQKSYLGYAQLVVRNKHRE